MELGLEWQKEAGAELDGVRLNGRGECCGAQVNCFLDCRFRIYRDRLLNCLIDMPRPILFPGLIILSTRSTNSKAIT